MRRRVALLAGAALVVLLALASVRSWDVSGLTPRIEAAFEHATGRALHVGGPVRFRLLPSPSLVAGEVSVADLPGGSRPAMLAADSVRARLDLGALLRRRVEVESLSLVRPVAVLETVNGVPNWVFHPRHEAGAVGPAHAPNRQRPWVRLDALEVTDGRLAWRARQLGSGEITLAHLHARRDGQGLTLVADARHGGVALALSLSAGTASGDARRVPVSATIELGQGADARVALDGDLFPWSRAFALHVHGRIGQLQALDGLFSHAGLPPAADLRGDARVGFAGGRWSVGALSLTAGKADPGRWVHGLVLDRFSLQATGARDGLAVDAAGTEAGWPVAVRGTVGSPSFWLGFPGEVPVGAPVGATLSMGGDRLAIAGTMTRTRARSGTLRGRLSLHAPDPSPLAAAGLKVGRALDADGPVTADERPGALSASLAGRFGAGGADFAGQSLSLSLEGRLLAVRLAKRDGAPWAVWSEDLGSRHVLLALHGRGLPAAPIISLAGGPGGLDGSLALDATLAREAGAGWSGPFEATLTDATMEPSLARSLIAPVLKAARLPTIGGPVAVRCASASGSLAGLSLALRNFSLASAALDGQGQGTVGLPLPGRLDLLVQPSLRVGPTFLSTSLSVTGAFGAPHFALAPVGGRFGLQIGPRAAGGACAAMGQAQGGARAPRKLPNAAALLRGLGLLR